MSGQSRRVFCETRDMVFRGRGDTMDSKIASAIRLELGSLLE